MYKICYDGDVVVRYDGIAGAHKALRAFRNESLRPELIKLYDNDEELELDAVYCLGKKFILLEDAEITNVGIGECRFEAQAFDEDGRRVIVAWEIDNPDADYEWDCVNDWSVAQDYYDADNQLHF